MYAYLSNIDIIKYYKFNSYAGGMAFARPYGLKSILLDTLYLSAAWFFLMTLKFISAPILE